MRNCLAVAAAALGLVACTFVPPARADDSPVKFKKITMSEKFYSEGATAGDFNHDGKMDYAAGGWWYEGPEFKKSHRYYEGEAFDTVKNTYSKNFFSYTSDFNKDGWDDILV